MTVEIKVEQITSATVIRGLVQPAKPKEVVLEEIMDDRHFEIAVRNQRLLDQLRADEALFLRYSKLLVAFDALSSLEGTSEKEKLGNEMEDIETSLIERLNSDDAEWFRGAIKHELWSESIDDFRKAFHVAVSSPEVRTKCVGRRRL